MEKRFSDFIPNFSTAKSPQQMMGVLAKTYFAEVNGVDPDLIYQVSIMPCTAKKFELERTEEMYASGHKDVDVALTTPRTRPHDQTEWSGFPQPARW